MGTQESNGSVTGWFVSLKNQDEAAATRLWERYFPRLLRLARHFYGGKPLPVIDAEDVAQSAFKSFCLRTMSGEIHELRDREGIWNLLAQITRRKYQQALERELAAKRGLNKRASAENLHELPLTGDHHCPQFLIEMAEQFDYLVRLLPDEQLKQIVLFKLEERSNEEIATSLDCSIRTIERKLARIRLIWAEHVSESLVSSNGSSATTNELV